MKTKIASLVFIFALLTEPNIFSQDTSIVQYFPMKVGNIWVYNWYHHMYPGINYYGKTRHKIINSVNANNKTYYIFSTQSSNPNYYYCGLGLFDTMRVDSVSGNVYRLTRYSGCSYSLGEVALDSLRALIGDSVYSWCGQSRYVCMDTANVNFLGSTRRSKNFVYDVFEHGNRRRYIKGIGLDSALDCYGTNICDYYLQGCVINGIVYGDTTMPVGILPISTEIPVKFNLYQNYPNPFNPVTKIRFDISKPYTSVRILIYNPLGEEIAEPVNDVLQAGKYEVEFDGKDLPSGIYLYRLISNDYSKTMKMVIIK